MAVDDGEGYIFTLGAMGFWVPLHYQIFPAASENRIQGGLKRGNFLTTLEQMYPVYETDLSVRTEIEELPSVPEFPTAARISDFVGQLEELMGRMSSTSYGPTQPHVWLVGRIPPKIWENCRETSERKARTHSYDDLVDLLIELAMERKNDARIEKYVRKHLRRETPAEKSAGGRSPEPYSNPWKGSGGQLKHM